MSDCPKYSLDAINVLDRFHEVDFVVFVEGDDDAYFWSMVFELCGVNYTYSFEVCNGVNKINEIVKNLIESYGNNSRLRRVIIARDSDYDVLSGRKLSCDRVIYTYGYSIENCIFNTEAILRLIKSNCRKRLKNNEDILLKEFLEKLYDCFYELWKSDYLSVVHCFGEGVLGKSCKKFLDKNEKGLSLNQEVVDRVALSDAVVKSFPRKIKLNKDNFIRWIRGHFLHSFVSCFIKSKGDLKVLSEDALFSQACGLMEYTLFCDKARKRYYKNICKNISV